MVAGEGKTDALSKSLVLRIFNSAKGTKKVPVQVTTNSRNYNAGYWLDNFSIKHDRYFIKQLVRLSYLFPNTPILPQVGPTHTLIYQIGQLAETSSIQR